MLRYLPFIGIILLSAPGFARSEEAEADIAKPVAFMKVGDFQRAIDEIDSIPQALRTVDVYLLRALCWANLGKDVEARAEIANAQALIPKIDEWHAESLAFERVRGLIEAPARECPIATAWLLGDAHRAVKLADAALQQAPENADLLELRGIARIAEDVEAHLIPDAFGSLAPAVRCDPSNPDRYITRGMWTAVFNYKDPPSESRAIEHAIADFSEAIRLNPSALAYQLRADAYLRNRDFKHAEEDLTQVLGRSQADKATGAAAFFCRAVLRRRLMDDAGARHDFFEAQQLKPAIVEDPLVAFAGISVDDEVLTLVRGHSSEVILGLLLDDLRKGHFTLARAPRIENQLRIARMYTSR